MKIKEYTKGSHTYRSRGKNREVESHNNPVGYAAEIDVDCTEIYALSGRVSFTKDRFLLEFGTAGNKISLKIRMHYQNMKIFAKDLQTIIDSSGEY